MGVFSIWKCEGDRLGEGLAAAAGKVEEGHFLMCLSLLGCGVGIGYRGPLYAEFRRFTDGAMVTQGRTNVLNGQVFLAVRYHDVPSLQLVGLPGFPIVLVGGFVLSLETGEDFALEADQDAVVPELVWRKFVILAHFSIQEILEAFDPVFLTHVIGKVDQESNFSGEGALRDLVVDVGSTFMGFGVCRCTQEGIKFLN